MSRTSSPVLNFLFRLLRTDYADKQPPVRMPGITAAITAFALGVKIVDGVLLRQLAGLLQVFEKMIALRIYICRDVMRNLAGCVAQSDPLIVRSRADPDGTRFVVEFRRLPKANMVSLTWII